MMAIACITYVSSVVCSYWSKAIYAIKAYTKYRCYHNQCGMGRLSCLRVEGLIRCPGNYDGEAGLGAKCDVDSASEQIELVIGKLIK